MPPVTPGKYSGSAFDRLKKEYDDQQKPYLIHTRPYYSSAGLVFNVAASVTVAGIVRSFAVAGQNQFNEFSMFGYGKGDTITLGFNIPRPAQDDDTNQKLKYETNDEDFAAEGFGVYGRGPRVQYSPANIAAFQAAGVVDQTTIFALQGLTVINDPGSVVVPPEFCSPLVLEDAVLQACLPKMTFTPSWSTRSIDLMGTGDEYPAGGAASYLRANGEPSHHNFARIPEGWIWRNEGKGYDRIFGMNVRLLEGVVIPITLPTGGYAAVTMPDLLFYEWRAKLFGRAFYEPSRNL